MQSRASMKFGVDIHPAAQFGSGIMLDHATGLVVGPLETRMGKGKGNVEYWVALVQPGKMLYEMSGVEEETAREAFRLAAAKLPVKTTFVQK